MTSAPIHEPKGWDMQRTTLSNDEHLKLMAILAKQNGEDSLLCFVGKMTLYKAVQVNPDGSPKYRLSVRSYNKIKEALEFLPTRT